MLLKKLLYATTNPGKLGEVQKFLYPHGITVYSPRDFSLDLEVEEIGSTLEENATLKAQKYQHALGNDVVVMSDDTGVEIDALGGEPGVHVRRWRGPHMSDQEIIDYCLERMRGVPEGKRGAQFRTVIAISTPEGNIETYDGTLRGVILKEPAPLRIPGFPFESLLYIPAWKLLLGDVHQMPLSAKAGYLTHRERALARALPRIQQLLRDLV